MAYSFPLLLTHDLQPDAQSSACSAEAALVAALQRGSQVAFRTLVEQYQDRIYGTIFSLLQNAEEAEDVAQEVFVEVYQTIARFRGEATLSTWLYRLATSRALKSLRKARAQKRFAFLTSLLGRPNNTQPNNIRHEPPDHAHPLALLEEQQQLQLLRIQVARLPEQQQVAFALRHEQELSYEQIAAVLGTSLSAVESLLFRARQTLRKRLQPHFRHA